MREGPLAAARAEVSVEVELKRRARRDRASVFPPWGRTKRGLFVWCAPGEQNRRNVCEGLANSVVVHGRAGVHLQHGQGAPSVFCGVHKTPSSLKCIVAPSQPRASGNGARYEASRPSRKPTVSQPSIHTWRAGVFSCARSRTS